MERRQPNLRMAIGAAAAAIGIVLGAELFDALHLGSRVLGVGIGAVIGAILGGFVVWRYNLRWRILGALP